MSQRVSVTQSELCRRLKALLAVGLGISAIQPDGTIVVGGQSSLDLPSQSGPVKSAADLALEGWLNRAKS